MKTNPRFYAIIAAALFGASAPLSKLLLGEIPPLQLAGLLYLGSGIGLLVWFSLRTLLTGFSFTHYHSLRARSKACPIMINS